ncbi:MAG TPA: hypothetical protein VHQ91_08065 [Geminicoccaceae bacterium]|nr:hypothetical protein [Geminicoccaceae bacterium]
MAALINCIRAGVLAIAILGTIAIGMLGFVFWKADGQSEARIWIRAGAVGCRLVTVSQGIGAEPCQS